MKWFNNLKIGTRIIVGFFIVIVLSCVIGIVGILNLNEVQQSYEKDYNNTAVSMEYLEMISSKFQQVRLNVVGYGTVAETKEEKDYYLERINLHKDVIAENIANYYKTFDNFEESEIEQERILLKNIENIVNEYFALTDNLMAQYDAKIITRAQFAAEFSKGGSARSLAQNTESVIRELINYNVVGAATQIALNEALAQRSIIIVVVLLAVSVVIAAVLGLYISRGISRPINKVVDAAGRLAKGDMDISFDTRYNDETGKLIEAFEQLVESTEEQAHIVELIADGDLTVEVPVRSEKDLLGLKLSQMVENLNELMANITIAADQVASGAQQISNSSAALSRGATEQASSIEELSASMEEVSSNTDTNAENAAQADELAAETKGYALTGNEHMKDMLVAMDEITQASNNINKIIKVIDDIAFQTNILALNAAVEAARAGQHGKGFAVVAEEVRNLAGRSADAVKETTNLIADSIKKSEAGAKIANETAEALDKIVKGVEAVSNLIGDIKRASVEQAGAITQIKELGHIRGDRGRKRRAFKPG